jgi:hypothetical protein
MDLNHPDSTDGQPENPQEGLLTVLDPGLFGDHAQERYALLRGALTDAKGASPDLATLDALMDALQKRRVRIQDALQEYAAVTDARRWPIFAVRPNTDHKKLEDRLLGMGFQIVPSLASAYREVGLIPLRVPPEAALLAQLGRRPDIQRVERAWLKGAAPRANPSPDASPLSPERLLQPGALPAELLSARDPVRVGLLDSGIDARHEVLQARLLDQRAFRHDQERVGDRFGQGTASAGVIARLCPSAMFLSARVLDQDGQGHLDEIIRALGWLRRQKPDLILCNLLMPLPPDGTSILSGLLRDIIEGGTPVIIPALTEQGALAPPACAQGILSVAPQGAIASKATLLARGQALRAPRSIQANAERFPHGSPTGWTTFSGPAAAAALTAGVACLLLKAARLHHQPLSPAQLTDALMAGLDRERALQPQLAIDHLLQTYAADAGAAPWELATLTDEPATMPLPTVAAGAILRDRRTRPLTDLSEEPPTDPARPPKKP